MIVISVNRRTIRQANNLLQAIALPPKKRALLLRRVAKNIATVSKSNITQQQTPEGRKWAKRQKGRTQRKAKMLLGLRKQIIVSGRSNENHAEVTLKKGNYRAHAGVIGKQHSKGNTRTITADKNHYNKTKKNSDGDISRAQAKAIVASGYKIAAVRMNSNAPKGKKKVPSIKWLMNNFSYEETRYAFWWMRTEGLLESSTSWQIKTPARQFLGADNEKTKKAWARGFQSLHYGRSR